MKVNSCLRRLIPFHHEATTVTKSKKSFVPFVALSFCLRVSA